MPNAARRLRIAFYAPLKSPVHPVPSGDRLMARTLFRCLEDAGHTVTIASQLRAFLGRPEDAAGWHALQLAAADEVARIAESWAEGAPDLWFTYHPYYKAPDLIGPVLAARFGLPLVTCEASYSNRRNIGIWAEMQALMLEMVKSAALNLCLTERDRVGLLAVAPEAALARFAPFIDTAPFAVETAPERGHLVAVAMMRAGDKYQSYVRLAAALALLPTDLDWRLSVAGDGPLQSEVRALFAGLPAGRIDWRGQMGRDDLARLLSRASVLVWPGCGEAYGLAYLEAQAAGLPVVAHHVAGVPEVVADGVTGYLVPEGDDAAFAGAIVRLLQDEPLRHAMGQTARQRVRDRHALAGAMQRLDQLLQGVMAR